MKRGPLAMFAVAALAACQDGNGANHAAELSLPPRAASGLDQTMLTIHSGGRTHRFTVEVARSAEQQERGLMGRRSLDGDRGMLFPFDPPRPAQFWMRNTLIPLDMIFIRPDGSIARIAANTVPMSEEMVGAEEPVTAVLELRGGRAAELGISEGDRISWAD